MMEVQMNRWLSRNKQCSNHVKDSGKHYTFHYSGGFNFILLTRKNLTITRNHQTAAKILFYSQNHPT